MASRCLAVPLVSRLCLSILPSPNLGQVADGLHRDISVASPAEPPSPTTLVGGATIALPYSLVSTIVSWAPSPKSPSKFVENKSPNPPLLEP